MGDRTGIEWADASWTPIRARRKSTGKIGWHCEHVTEACRFCYAETRNANPFYGNGLAYKPGHRKDVEIFLDAKMLLKPIQWQRPRKIFVCSMTDLFADFVKDEWIDRILAVATLAPRHTFQLLTKRPARMAAYMRDKGSRLNVMREADKLSLAYWKALPANLDRWPLENVWAGTSICDQPDADAFIWDLISTPAVTRFVSAEPLLGLIDLTRVRMPVDFKIDGEPYTHFDALRGVGKWGQHIHGVIAGGESGKKGQARPMNPNHATALRDQCAAAGTAFFFKQHGEFIEAPATARKGVSRPWGEDGPAMVRPGKKNTGRLLDGVEHNSLPA